MTVLDVINNLKGKGYSNNDINEELKDKTVLARYGNLSLYKINSIDFSSNPIKNTFVFRDKSVSVIDYMLSAYKVSLKNTSQPLITSIIEPKQRRGKKGPKGQKLETQTIFLVPELCYLTGISEELKNDHEFMKNLADYTKLEPQRRVDKYKELLNSFEKINIKQESPVSLWGVKIDTKPVIVEGTLLPPPTLILGKGKTFPMDNRGTFILKEEVFAPMAFRKWAFIHTSRDEDYAGEVVDTMKKASRAFGITIADPMYISATGMRAQNFIEAASKAAGAEIYVFFLPPPAKNEYGRIKAEMLKRGLTSQMIISKKQKNLMSVASKIVLQMNAKLKGILWKLKLDALHLAKVTMMVGIDVSTDKGKTVMAFTSSYDPAFMSYHSQIKRLEAGQNVADSMKGFMKEAVEVFYKATNNKFYPEHVIAYRQGVGEMQFENVFNNEVKSCLDVVNSLSKSKLIFSIMNKRVNDRAFVSSAGGHSDKRGGSYGGLSNPPCGTLIDHTTVDGKRYEFSLQPQFVNQGTGTPTKFTVLYDNTGLDNNEYKLLTYNLCYGYQNWMGGIRTPAPTMYAAKLAKLVVKSAKNQDPQGNLCNTLHYL
jgi:aubergine-like protein